MTKKKEKKDDSSLEDRFIEVLKSNKIAYHGKLFNIGDKLYLPDFVFNTLIVEVEDCISDNRTKVIRQFRKEHPNYTLILLTADHKRCVEAAKEFNEVFDIDSVSILLSEIKKHMTKGTN
jgi:hypothetical protein